MTRRTGDPAALAEQGIALHVAGKLAAAVEAYRAALAGDPGMPPVWVNLGLALEALGSGAAALEAYEQACRHDAANRQALGLLGIGLLRAGRPAAALPWLDRAAGLDPGQLDIQVARGNALQQDGRIEEAKMAFGAVLAGDPDHATARTHLGNILCTEGRLAEAIECHRRALAAAPRSPQIWANLGVALERDRRPDEAVDAFQRAVVLLPGYVAAWSNLALSLCSLDRQEAAIACADRALLLDPNWIDAHLNRGLALRALGRVREAGASLQRALDIAPDHPEALADFGKALTELGYFEGATSCLERALSLKPDSAEAHMGLAVVSLLRGDLARGWREYEWRWRGPAVIEPDMPDPSDATRWDGIEDLAGKTLLVWAEQGVGDAVIFGSALADIIGRTGRVVLAVAPKLVVLFARSFPAASVVSNSSPIPGHDRHLPMGSLFGVARPDLGSFAKTPRAYLRADPGRIAAWRDRLGALGGPTVGLCWRSSLVSVERQRHFFHDAGDLGPILVVPGIRFVNLQSGPVDRDIDLIHRRFGVTLHRFPEVDLFDDIDESAALISALDLVISAPTMTGVLAGALGVPSWLFHLRRVHWSDFDTGRLPWQPAVTLFQRNWDEPWAPVTRAMAEALAARAARA
jgi:tetratricopeptide (TPR) repeat protein